MIKHLPGWIPIDELTSIQNDWMERYIRPSVTVNFPLWAKGQPRDFSLEYLLSHALENGWDLTKLGWNKAYELGVAQHFENPASNAPSEYEGWFRHCEASRRVVEQMDGEMEFEDAKSRLSKRINAGKIRTNGKRYRELRIDPVGVDAWILELRNKAMEKEYED